MTGIAPASASVSPFGLEACALGLPTDSFYCPMAGGHRPVASRKWVPRVTNDGEPLDAICHLNPGTPTGWCLQPTVIKLECHRVPPRN